MTGFSGKPGGQVMDCAEYKRIKGVRQDGAGQWGHPVPYSQRGTNGLRPCDTTVTQTWYPEYR